MVTVAAPLGRPFWTFWTAASLANIGDGIRLAAFPLLAASLTASPVGVAAVDRGARLGDEAAEETSFQTNSAGPYSATAGGSA